MSLSTFSVFYTNIVVSSENKYLNFDEGGGELTAILDPGTYTLTQIQLQLKTQLDAVGANTYLVDIDRDTRVLTISADGTFDLLTSSGSQNGTSIFDDIGFTQTTDLTGLTTYSGAIGAASEYVPQFIVQDYTKNNHYKEKISPTVNESASGRIQVVSFGTRTFFEMSFKFITDKAMDNKVILNNPNGVADCVAFMDIAIEKGELEFMANKDDRATFETVILESTSVSSTGTGYKLKELVGQNLPEYYELTNLKFRVV